MLSVKARKVTALIFFILLILSISSIITVYSLNIQGSIGTIIIIILAIAAVLFFLIFILLLFSFRHSEEKKESSESTSKQKSTPKETLLISAETSPETEKTFLKNISESEEIDEPLKKIDEIIKFLEPFKNFSKKVDDLDNKQKNLEQKYESLLPIKNEFGNKISGLSKKVEEIENLIQKLKLFLFIPSNIVLDKLLEEYPPKKIDPKEVQEITNIAKNLNADQILTVYDEIYEDEGNYYDFLRRIKEEFGENIQNPPTNTNTQSQPTSTPPP